MALVFVLAAPAVGAPSIAGAVVREIKHALCIVSGDICTPGDAARAGPRPVPAALQDDRRRGVGDCVQHARSAASGSLTVTPQSDGTVSVVRTAGATGGLVAGGVRRASSGPVRFEAGAEGTARARGSRPRAAGSSPTRATADRFLEHSLRNALRLSSAGRRPGSPVSSGSKRSALGATDGRKVGRQAETGTRRTAAACDRRRVGSAGRWRAGIKHSRDGSLTTLLAHDARPGRGQRSRSSRRSLAPAATTGSSSTRATRAGAARARAPRRDDRDWAASRSPRRSPGSTCATRRTSPAARPFIDSPSRGTLPAARASRRSGPDRHARRSSRRSTSAVDDRSRGAVGVDQARPQVQPRRQEGQGPAPARRGDGDRRRRADRQAARLPARGAVRSAQVVADVPGPELDEVAVRVVDVGGAGVRARREGVLGDVGALGAQVGDGARRSRPRRCAWRSGRGRRRGRRSRPTWGFQRPIRVRSPAITQIASRSGQRSTTGRPSRPA